MHIYVYIVYKCHALWLGVTNYLQTHQDINTAQACINPLGLATRNDVGPVDFLVHAFLTIDPENHLIAPSIMIDSESLGRHTYKVQQQVIEQLFPKLSKYNVTSQQISEYDLRKCIGFVEGLPVDFTPEWTQLDVYRIYVCSTNDMPNPKFPSIYDIAVNELHYP